MAVQMLLLYADFYAFRDMPKTGIAGSYSETSIVVALIYIPSSFPYLALST
jgi:hypothetical protein